MQHVAWPNDAVGPSGHEDTDLLDGRAEHRFVLMASSSDILLVLDARAEAFEFPGFKNMNHETADSRLHCVRDGDRWALVIEQVVDWPSSGGAMTIIHAMGDTRAEAFRTRPLFELTVDDELPTSVALGGRKIPIDAARANELANELGVGRGFALLILLRDEQRNALFATRDELADCVAPGLRLILELDEWAQPDVYGGPKPSESEAFRQLAEVLATGDTTQYAPTEAANSRDWRMWLASR